jgi:hypothetical protein
MRRLVEDFAAALEGRGSVSTSEPALAPLLNLAQQLQALPLGPSPAFRDSLRQRLVAVATVAEPAPAPAPIDRARELLRGWRVQRQLRAGAAVVACAVMISGVATVSSRSLPGDPLYRIKRVAESAQVQLARGDLGRGKRELQHAGTRLDEVGKLASAPGALAPSAAGIGAALGANKGELIVDTLGDMDGATRRGVERLFEASRKTGSTEPLAVIRDFATRQQSELAAVLPALPAVARGRAAESLALLARIRTTTTAEIGRLANCAGADCPPANTAGCHCTPGDSAPPVGAVPGDPGTGVPGLPGGPAGPALPTGPGAPTTKPRPSQAPDTEPSELPDPVASEVGDLLESLPPLPEPEPVSKPPVTTPTAPATPSTPPLTPLPSLPGLPTGPPLP